MAECSKESILQYFRPSFTYHLSLRYLFCLFLSGLFIQVLLYHDFNVHERAQRGRELPAKSHVAIVFLRNTDTDTLRETIGPIGSKLSTSRHFQC